jgi:hypothetical protein
MSTLTSEGSAAHPDQAWSTPVQHAHELVADWLEVTGQPQITICRSNLAATGDVLSALWLTYVLDEHIPVGLERGHALSVPDGFLFVMDVDECTAATGLTAAQQVACRAKLSDLDLLTVWRADGYLLHLARYNALRRERAKPLAIAMAQCLDGCRPPQPLGRARKARA